MQVINDGISPNASHTQTGASDTSALPINADRVAVTRRIPTVSSNSPKPNCTVPNSSRSISSGPVTAVGWASGKATIALANADSAAAGSIGVPPPRRMITIMAAMPMVIARASSSPVSRPCSPAAVVITATPTTATTLATNVVQRSRSEVHHHASAAVASGAAALITATSATVVWRSALMKHTVENVENAAAASPTQPIPRIAAIVRPRCSQTM
jgi:hypothetical protein